MIFLVGRLLQERRRTLGLTITQVAVGAGIRREYLSSIESGKRFAGVRTLLALTELLTLSRNEWLGAYLQSETRILPLIRLGEHLIQIGDIESTIATVERLRKVTRESTRYNQRVHHLQGLLSYRQGRYARAVHWFTLCEKARANTGTSIERAKDIYNVALALRKTRRYVASLHKFDKVVHMFDALDARQQAGYARLSKANTLLELQAYREALLEYRRAAFDLRADPWVFDCKLGAIICYSRLQGPNRALAMMPSIEKYAMGLDREARYHHNIGVFYRQSGLLESAMDHLSVALHAHAPDLPPRPDSLAEMALCRALAGDKPGAQGMLDHFRAFEGAKDPQDVLSMAVLSHAIGNGAVQDLLPKLYADGYENRLVAAISLLQRRDQFTV